MPDATDPSSLCLKVDGSCSPLALSLNASPECPLRIAHGGPDRGSGIRRAGTDYKRRNARNGKPDHDARHRSTYRATFVMNVDVDPINTHRVFPEVPGEEGINLLT